MAQIRLQPPDAFNFREPEEWTRWKGKFKQFRVTSGLEEEDPEKQVSEERKMYNTVVQIFDLFKIRKNVIYERACYSHRNQLQEETAEQYVMALYTVASNCEYGRTN